jgi:hypothetical protein
MRVTGYLLAAIAAAGSVVASNNATSRVNVHIPSKLQTPGGVGHVQAEFGFQQSSGSISSFVYFIDRPLCRAIDYKNMTQIYPFPTGGLKSPFILLVDGSNCSAVAKARHAQLAGASALVIADEHCRCSDKNCTDKFGPECQPSDPVLVNDGSGSDVSIPSFLLFKTAAESVKEQLKKNQTVLMELTWGLKDDVQTTSQPVNFSLWTTAHDPVLDIETYVNLRTVAAALKDTAYFSPCFSLLDGSRFQCNEEADTKGPCDHLCTNHGRYCAVHARDLSGYAIVRESLRRLCIWRHYGDPPNNNDAIVYWDYVIFHLENCHDPNQYVDPGCLQKSMAHAKIDEKVIDQCMSDTGDLDENVPNTLLDDMLVKQERSGVVSLPAIAVNQKVLDHTSSYSLFEAICYHFWLSGSPSVPDVCETCGSCPNKIGCLEHGHCVPFSHKQVPQKKKHRGWTTPILFFFAFLIGGGVWYYYKRRDEFNYRAGLVTGYMQLRGSPDA